jgi:hypothetical protein
MRRSRFPKTILLAAALLALAPSSCSRYLGWGVLLWSNPGSGLHAGAVVPIYIKSNIEKLYVVGVPGSTKKIEVPLWQIDLYRSRGQAEKALKDFGNLLTSYLFANRDGLPVRDKATNASKRVYRLREGQSVKVLSPAVGELVSSGDEILEGQWYRIVTEDGTKGFVFSNTMRMYDELTESPPSTASTSPGDSAKNVDLVFSRNWRAEYFQAMIDEGRVDLDVVSPRYGFFADSVRRQIRIELPAVSEVFNYSSIAQSGGDFVFEGTPLRIRFEGDRRMIADWSGGETRADTVAMDLGANPFVLTAPQRPQQTQPTQPSRQPASSRPSGAPEPGTPPPGSASGGNSAEGSTAAAPSAPVVATAAESPVDSGSDPASAPPSATATQAIFVVLGTDLRDAIRVEETRRLNGLSAFLSSGESWTMIPEALPVDPAVVLAEGATPSGAGTEAQALPTSELVLSRSGRFTWTDIMLVPPSYLPDDLGAVDKGTASGEATVRLVLAPALQTSWEGVVSFRYDGTGVWENFLYRHEAGKLELIPPSPGSIRDLTVGAASAVQPLAFKAKR